MIAIKQTGPGEAESTPGTASPRFTWFALTLAALTALAFQGSRGFRETTEGRYVECTRQTIQSGQLTEPILNGANHWSKPPLTYWAIAAGIKLLGQNPWGARAYLALAFILTVTTVLFLGTELWGARAGPLCALIYATAPFTVGAANIITTDTLLVLWEALALTFFWMGIKRRQDKYFIWMWLALGLAFSTKGPPALLPLLGILPTYWIAKRHTQQPPRLLSLTGFAAFAISGLSWYLLEIVRHPELLRYWVINEIVGRNIKGTANRNPELYNIFTLYLPFLLIGTGPWPFILLAKRKQLPWPKRKWTKPLHWQHGLEWTFLLLTFTLPLAILCISKSKLILYILPLFLPMSLALGKGIETLWTKDKLRLATIIAVALSMALTAIIAKKAVAHIPNHRNMGMLHSQFEPLRAQHPEHRLYIAQNRTLNGLQFYLRERIEPLSKQGLRALLTNPASEAGPALLLINNANLEKHADILARPSLKTLRLNNPFWSVIIDENIDPTDAQTHTETDAAPGE